VRKSAANGGNAGKASAEMVVLELAMTTTGSGETMSLWDRFTALVPGNLR